MLKYNFIIIFLFATIFLSCTPPRYYRLNNNANTNIYYSGDNNIDFQDFRFIDKDENNFYEDYESNNKFLSKKPVFYTDNIQKSKKYRDKSDIDQKDISQKPNIKINQDKYKTYRVKKGDNLLKISKKFGTSINDIIVFNKIKNRNKIYAGMIIKIPNGKIQKSVDPKISVNNNNKKKNPYFSWPIKDVYNIKRDGSNGVKSIGIIITGKPGTSVLSSADGIVIKVGHMRGFGNYVILKHINNYLTIYSNLKEVKVIEGDRIVRGKIIGNVNGNDLHFQIGYSGKPKDPLLYLSKKS